RRRQGLRRSVLPGASGGVRRGPPRHVQPDVPVLHARQARDPGARRRLHARQEGHAQAVPRRVHLPGRTADSAGPPDPARQALASTAEPRTGLPITESWERSARERCPASAIADVPRLTVLAVSRSSAPSVIAGAVTFI